MEHKQRGQKCRTKPPLLPIAHCAQGKAMRSKPLRASLGLDCEAVINFSASLREFANTNIFRFGAFLSNTPAISPPPHTSSPCPNTVVQRSSSWKFEQVCFLILSEEKRAHAFQPANGGQKSNHLNRPFCLLPHRMNRTCPFCLHRFGARISSHWASAGVVLILSPMI